MTQELPQGWTWSRVSDVTEAVASIKPESEPERDFAYVDISAINNSTFSISDAKAIKGKDAPSRARRPVQPGDTLFSNVRTYLRNIALVPEGSQANVCSTGFTLLRPNGAVDPRYLFRYTLTDAFIDRVTPLQTGTHYPATSDRVVMEENIPLPPFAEQQRIVAKLEVLLGKVDACRKRLEKIPVILKRFRQSVLAAACTGRLTADWREVGYSDEEFPDGWELRKLDSLFTIRSGGTPSRKVKEYYEGGTIPWVKTGEVQNCDICRTEEFITEAAVNTSNAKVFPSGTIVVAMYGEGRTRGQIGRLAFPAATNQACAALINTEIPRITNQYVFYTLLGHYDLLRAQSAGGNQPNLNLGIIKEWKIPMPPLPEQQEIVRRVDTLSAVADQIETRYAKAKTHVDRLTQSILAKAFRGDLVQQDPEDEPASVLLERIRIQRQGAGAARSQPRRKSLTAAGAVGNR